MEMMIGKVLLQASNSGVLVLNNGNPLDSFISNSPNENSVWFGDASAVLSPGYDLTIAALFCGG